MKTYIRRKTGYLVPPDFIIANGLMGVGLLREVIEQSEVLHVEYWPWCTDNGRGELHR